MSVNLLTDFQGNQLPLANDNLLINSDFRNSINQREQSSYSTSSEREFTVDRFYISGSASLNVNDGYLAVTLNNTSSELGQPVEIPLTLINHLTLSMKLLNVDKPYIASIENVNTMAASEAKTASIGGNGIFRIYRNVNAQGDYFTAQLRATGSATFNIEWLKLEIGLIATPFIPRLLAKEFNLCERFYQIIDNLYLSRYNYESASKLSYFNGFPFRTKMRAVPNVTGTCGYGSVGTQATDNAIRFCYLGKDVPALESTKFILDSEFK